MLNITEGEILLVNKPYRWTSFDVIGSLRGLIKHLIGKKIKIGHAGTLDPLATGLLIVCTGKATKRIEEFKDFDKEYTGTFTLGATTASYDMEKEVNETFATDHITPEMIEEAAKNLSGDIMQIPPMFSAIKVDGKRAYESARKDKDLGLAARPVCVPEFEITRIEMPEVISVLFAPKAPISVRWHAISGWPSTVARTSALCAAHGLDRIGLRMHIPLTN